MTTQFESPSPVLHAEYDAAVMLIQNTRWTRAFFKRAANAFKRPKAMTALLAEDVRLHGERPPTLEQVLMYLLLKDPRDVVPKVRDFMGELGRAFCLCSVRSFCD